jgi:transcriptional regulator with XRE-family HTH domain
MIAFTEPARDAATIATNLRRLMARDGLTYDDVVAATGLDERTIRALLRCKNTPHARTLNKLAAGLGVPVDELFRPPARSPAAEFDRATNSLIEEIVAQHPESFAGWSDTEFSELYSRFGTGGALSEAGILAAVEALNAKRAVLDQVSIILESGEASALREYVAFLYERATESVETIRRDA